MRSIWLVTRREWSQRTRTTAFRISTLLSVLLVLVIILMPDMYGGGDRKERAVGLVGETSSELPGLLRATGDQLDLDVETRRFSDEAVGRTALRSDGVAVLLIDQQRMLWRAEVDDQLRSVVAAAVGVLEQREKIGGLGLTPAQAERLLAPPELSSSSLEPATAESTERKDLAWIGLGVLFMAIAFYGGFVLTGVVEEKASRVVEVLLSRLRPHELLAGKILGIGSVGLAQLSIVAASALVARRFAENPSASTTPGTIIWIVFWFVLGYGFYAALYAASGSLVSRQEEAQSIQLPVSGVLFVAYFFSMEAIQSPDGAAALAGSLLPPTAPMVMIARIAHGGVPVWQIVGAVALVVVSVYALVRLAGRIYAGGVLRFGGRVSLKEAWRGAVA